MRHDHDAAAAAATVADDLHAGLLDDLLGRVAGCFPRRETRRSCRQMVSGLLMELDAHNCWTIAEAARIRAAFTAGDEVYSGRELRRGIRRRGMGYVMAVRADHNLATGPGCTVAAAGAVSMIPARAWHRMRTGSGTKGVRHYDWATLEVTSDDTPGGHAAGHSVLLIRRHRYTGTLSGYRCWTPGIPIA